MGELKPCGLRVSMHPWALVLATPTILVVCHCAVKGRALGRSCFERMVPRCCAHIPARLHVSCSYSAIDCGFSQITVKLLAATCGDPEPGRGHRRA
jgi:hypothetical protein